MDKPCPPWRCQLVGLNGKSSNGLGREKVPPREQEYVDVRIMDRRRLQSILY